MATFFSNCSTEVLSLLDSTPHILGRPCILGCYQVMWLWKPPPSPTHLKNALMISQGRDSVWSPWKPRVTVKHTNLMCWEALVLHDSWVLVMGNYAHAHQRGVVISVFSMLGPACAFSYVHIFGQKGQRGKIEQNTLLKWEKWTGLKQAPFVAVNTFTKCLLFMNEDAQRLLA